jgi:predicted ATP-dependent endonuclease of OLD family
LKLLVEEPGFRFSSIAERSDGLRQFLALLAFAHVERSDEDAILLIDEAETHLHYDAQADLVQMLAKQEIVSKVIYSTHSIGCLPEDLGTGVRFVDMISPGSSTSTIRNWFWESDRPGFSPLLFGMGASTLAFIPVRNAVATEGISDSILWPTLLREAADRSHLDFQVVPGISEATLPEITQLDREAPRTVYLVDSDKSGNALRNQLKGAGIPNQRIFSIPDTKKQGLEIEDLIDPEVYLEAVNAELNRSNNLGVSFPASALPTAGRPKAVKDWCQANKLSTPKKRAVAYRIIERAAERRILAKVYSRPLERLYAKIIRVLSSQDSGT